jgi:hypothetical protein
VQFFDQILPKEAPDYAGWIQKMEQSIKAWRECAISEGDTPGLATLAANVCRLLLHRPCSRNIVPSEPSLRAASAIAIEIIDGCWELVRGGNLIFVFQYVFNVFQAGMVLLYALRNHAPTVQESSLEAETRRVLDLLTPLFVSTPVAILPHPGL